MDSSMQLPVGQSTRALGTAQACSEVSVPGNRGKSAPHTHGTHRIHVKEALCGGALFLVNMGKLFKQRDHVCSSLHR